jgi:DNA-binding CsgD family transcriptional regulator
LVSLTSDHSRKAWIEFKKKNIAKLCLLATLIDSAACVTRKNLDFRPELSEQEKRCLACFASGKNRIDIAKYLDLTESDVELCLDTARHKLNCITVTQAVSIAIATKVLSPEALH